MMNNLRNSLLMSVQPDISRASSEEDAVHPPEIIPATLPNYNIAPFNIGSSSTYSGAGGTNVANTGKESTAKPRGRPRLSKNRPKGRNMAMKPGTLDVPDGVDIIEWVVGFANSNKVCITVVGGFGKVSLAILSSLASQAPPLLYKEHLTLINLSGTYLFSPLAECSPTFSASLGRVNGEVIGGPALRMVTMGKVGLTAYVFEDPEIIAIKA